MFEVPTLYGSLLPIISVVVRDDHFHFSPQGLQVARPWFMCSGAGMGLRMPRGIAGIHGPSLKGARNFWRIPLAASTQGPSTMSLSMPWRKAAVASH